MITWPNSLLFLCKINESRLSWILMLVFTRQMYLSWTSSQKQQFEEKIVAQFGHLVLIPIQYAFFNTQCCIRRRDASTINFTVFSWTQPRTAYTSIRTLDEHSNNYTMKTAAIIEITTTYTWSLQYEGGWLLIV